MKNKRYKWIELDTGYHLRLKPLVEDARIYEEDYKRDQ